MHTVAIRDLTTTDSRRAFMGVTALVFATSAVGTVAACARMSAMGEMSMPGGWTLSMMWMRMPGQTWTAAWASFAAMWTAMMVAMMLPSIAPALWRYCQTVERCGSEQAGWLTTIVALAYFLVWFVIGLAVFTVGVPVAAVELQHAALARHLPIVSAGIVLIAGVLQIAPWKARFLAFCRTAPTPARTLTSNARAAWRHGIRLGLSCSVSCAPLTALVLVVGINDLRAMSVVAAAITAERLAPNGVGIARRSGAAIIVAGLFLIATSLR